MERAMGIECASGVTGGGRVDSRLNVTEGWSRQVLMPKLVESFPSQIFYGTLLN
jgi:hypothetical protein